jgi:uncharacterized membrane protein (UPF0127 family)
MKHARIWWGICAVAVIVLAAFGGWRATHSTIRHELRTSHVTYRLDLANTPELQAKGLGGRASMERGQGMIFVFDAPAKQCFWMKDMHFSLDIIWLDAQKKVVHIEKNVSPDTFPKSYCPTEPAQYVIELNAGEAQKSDIHVGQTLRFDE